MPLQRRPGAQRPTSHSGDIPIVVGGKGRRRTLRLVAEHADASNFGGSPETIAELVRVLERHCEDVGRDPAEIAKTVGGIVLVGETHEDARRQREEHRATAGIAPQVYDDAVIWGAPDEVAEEVAARLAAGGTGFIATLPDPFDLETVDLVGRTLAPLFTAAPTSTSPMTPEVS